MNRRQFTATVAGLLVTVAQPASQRRYALRPPRQANHSIFLLEAVVAARLPELLGLVETHDGDLAGPALETRPLPPLLELRTYSSPVSIPGIEPWLVSPARYLIPFESLSHREQFWRKVTARQAWPAYQFAIYRPVPALRTT